MSRTWATLLMVALCGEVLSAQQARDGRTPTRVGTASLSGIVLSDDRDATPLRRARVSLTGSELAVGYTTIAADDGTFRFERLPAGRYTVTAVKEGWVPLTVRPQTESMTSAELREGESRRLTLRLQKGAVITGMVTAPDGTPAVNAPVTPLLRRFNGALGERRMSAVPFAGTTTDDRGIYRIYGLAPGSYVIASNPRVPGITGGVRVMTEGDIKRALSEVKEQTFAARPGFPTAPPPAAKTTDTSATIMAAPIYFPGTASETQATPVTVAAGEVRTGIDIDLQYVRPATIQGYVAVPDGTRAQVALNNADAAASLQSSMTASTGADGGFMFRNVAPGHYTLTARAMPATARGEAMPRDLSGLGRTDVIVSGDDISGIAITLRPPVRLSGRIRFDGEGAEAAAIIMALGLRRLSLPLNSTEVRMGVPLPSVEIDGDRFAVSVLPVRYRFQMAPQGLRAPIGRWWLSSIVAAGKELLDTGIEITEDVDDAVITFSDKASELSGTARSASGAALRDGHVVIFSADPEMWFWQSRRIAAVPLVDGRYSVKNLPAGEYFVTTADGLERNEWFDAEMLATLAKSAQRLTLRQFEAKTFDVVR